MFKCYHFILNVFYVFLKCFSKLVKTEYLSANTDSFVAYLRYKFVKVTLRVFIWELLPFEIFLPPVQNFEYDPYHFENVPYMRKY